jgi:CRP-like cAMP-binding protein
MPPNDIQTTPAKPARGQVTSVVANAMGRFVSFSEAEVSALHSLERRHESVRKGGELVTPGQKQSKPFIVIGGSVIEYRVNANGQRQALEILLRGEIANLRSTVLRSTDIYMVAGTDAVVSRFTAADFHRVISGHPRLAAVMIWRAAVGRSMLAEHLLDVGRRNAYQRVGHRLLELLVRMELAGASESNTLSVPLELVTLSDMLGLTVEYTSRTLTRLRDDGLVEASGRYIKILDRERLEEVSDFNSSYLHPDGFPEDWGRR